MTDRIIELLKKHYDVKYEKMPDTDEMWYVVCSQIDGGYIGRPEDAYKFIEQGITDIQKANPNDETCSIGFSPSKQKWYGWSHRARCGFGIGDIVTKGDCCASSGWTEEWLQEHPEEDTSLPVGFEAKTIEDAKLMAIAYSDAVS